MIRHLAILALCLCFALSRAEESAVIQQLHSGLTGIPSANGVWTGQKGLVQGLPLRVEYDATGHDITHLGVALFEPSMQQAVHPDVWRATERIMLTLLLADSDARRQTWLREQGVRLFSEAVAFGTGTFTTIQRIMPVLRQPQGIEVVDEDERLRVLLTGGPNGQLMRLSLPKDRELLQGTDKKEADEVQCRRIRSHRHAASPKAAPAADELGAVASAAADSATVWHTFGQPLYIDSLRTDSYWHTVAGGALEAVYTAAHPKESVRNLLLGCVVPQGLDVEVRHQQYGGVSATWQQPWPVLLDALQSEPGVVSYAACQLSSDGRQCTGILVVRGMQVGSLHMLLLSLPRQQLGSTQPATLQALLYTNIPQHNVLTLFEERVRK